jgi:hypothetical protein
MDTVRVIHDPEGQSLTVWFGDPTREAASGEDEYGVIVMRDKAGLVLGVEILGYTGTPGSVLLQPPLNKQKGVDR